MCFLTHLGASIAPVTVLHGWGKRKGKELRTLTALAMKWPDVHMTILKLRLGNDIFMLSAVVSFHDLSTKTLFYFTLINAFCRYFMSH